MSVHTEEEEIQQIKEWWKENGSSLLLGGALALALVVGWNVWHDRQARHSEGGSLVFQQLVETTLQSKDVDPAKVNELTEKLNKEYGDTGYAVYASLLRARTAVDTGHLDDAAAELRRLMASKLDTGMAEIVRQRLARVLAAQDKTDEALALLAGDAVPAFVAGREELRGDLLVRLGRKAEARTAYEKARAAMPQDAGLGVLQTKLDDLADKEA